MKTERVTICDKSGLHARMRKMHAISVSPRSREVPSVHQELGNPGKKFRGRRSKYMITVSHRLLAHLLTDVNVYVADRLGAIDITLGQAREIHFDL